MVWGEMTLKKGSTRIRRHAPDGYVLTVRRFDGEELSILLERDEARYLAEHIQLLLETEKRERLK